MGSRPILAINHKLHRPACGTRAGKFATSLAHVASDFPHVRVVLCPASADLSCVVDVANRVGSIEVWAQAAEGVGWGSHTGALSVDHLVELGVSGTLVNHAERGVSEEEIASLISQARTQNFLICACASDDEAAARIAALSPDLIAVEPPGLIGGDISVTSADPDLISQSVHAVEEVDSSVGLLCGAGVKTGDDVRIALELGTKGVLLASGVTKADEPDKALRNLLSGLK